jgi:response regulator of citrate/malate metabolism
MRHREIGSRPFKKGFITGGPLYPDLICIDFGSNHFLRLSPYNGISWIIKRDTPHQKGGQGMNRLKVLFAEPDPMLCRIYEQLIDDLSGYRSAGSAGSGPELRAALEREPVNLVFLDIALPDLKGLEGFLQMRSAFNRSDFIILSSERDPETVRGAICSGAFDYLIKPFDWKRLKRALDAYSDYHNGLTGRTRPWRQEDLDRLLGFRERLFESKGTPKGFQESVLQAVAQVLAEAGDPLSAAEVGRHLGISRSCARRYLELLLDRGEISLKFRPTTVGRPEKRYFSSHFRCQKEA